MQPWRMLTAARTRSAAFSSVSSGSLFVNRMGARDTKHLSRFQFLERLRLGELTRDLERNLRDGRHQTAVQLFHKAMCKPNIHSNASRFKAYERATYLFLHSGYAGDAGQVYGRMQDEGFMPPHHLKVCMDVMRSLDPDRLQSSMYAAVRQAVTSNAFDERCLRNLLRVLFATMPCRSHDIEGIVQMFLNTRDRGYQLAPGMRSFLAYLHTRLGDTDTAQKWRSSKPRTEELPTSVGSDGSDGLNPRAILLTLAQRFPDFSPIVSSAILRCNRSGAAHDRILYNTLIQTLAVKQRYEEVFAVYQLMLQSGANASPDAYTYGSLLPILSRFSQPRTARARKHKRPANAPSARELFSDMVRLHELYTRGRPRRPSCVISVSLLNKFLTSFMKSDDYAAAYLTLRTFDVCNLMATVDTYKNIVAELLRRAGNELSSLQSSSPGDLWTYRFLGRPPARVEVDVLLMDGVLRLGLQSRLSLDGIQLAHPSLADELARVLDGSDVPTPTEENTALFEIGQQPDVLPAPLVLLGLLEPARDEYGARPLERILRRAILASYQRLFVPPSKAVSQAISAAKDDMGLRYKHTRRTRYSNRIG